MNDLKCNNILINSIFFFIYNPGAFHTTASNESWSDWYKIRVSTLLEPHWFSKPDVLGAHLPQADPQDKGCLMWGLIFSLLRKDLPTPDIPPPHGLSHPQFGSLPLLPLSVWLFFYLSLWKNCSAGPEVVSRGRCIRCSCSLSVSMGGGELRVLLSLLPSQAAPLIPYLKGFPQ